MNVVYSYLSDRIFHPIFEQKIINFLPEERRSSETKETRGVEPESGGRRGGKKEKRKKRSL